MAGMRALGREYNVIAAASGVGIRFKECSGIGILALNNSAAGTISVTVGTTLSGSYENYTTANGCGQPPVFYSGTATGAGTWTKNTASWSSNSLTLATGNNEQSYVDFLTSEMPDQYQYLKVTAGGCTITAIQYDLTVQRDPANLVAPSS